MPADPVGTFRKRKSKMKTNIVNNFLGKIKALKFLSSITIFLISGTLVISVLSFSSLQAATQGSQGSTSSGTIENIVTVGRVIWIRSLRDFNFGVWNAGDGTLSDNDNVCIGKNDFFAPYSVRAAGDGDGFDPAAFTLSNGIDQINYNVNWNDNNGTAGNTPVTPGLILHGQTGGAFGFFLNVIGFCFTNANLQIEIPDTELSSAIGGSYAGTLTLLIIPD